MKRYFSIIFILSVIFNLSFAQEQDSLATTNSTDEAVRTMQIAQPEDLIARATLAYDNGNFRQSIDDYETLLTIYGQAPDLFYNLGNAYFKEKNFAKAILNYERCLIYDPNNADASANLELAKASCVDKIESIQPVIFKTWSDAVCNFFSCSAWTNLAIAFFLLFSICMGAYFFVHKTAVRKTGFYLAIPFIVLCCICNIYANQQNNRIAIRDHAVVIAPSVTVKSSPADSGTQLFTVHEGLKVRVRTTLGEWSEVELSDGNVGWLPSSAVEII